LKVRVELLRDIVPASSAGSVTKVTSFAAPVRENARKKRKALSD